MTASQAASQPFSLAPATFNGMLRNTMDTLPHHRGATADEIATQREAAYLVIEALRPRDPLESMLATRVVATHYHAMHDLGCATQLNLPPNLQLRYQGRACTLSRLMDATLHTLMDRQTAAPRCVAGLPAVAAAARAQPAPEPVRADPPPAPTPTVAAEPTPAAPAQGAPAQAVSAQGAVAPAPAAAAPVNIGAATPPAAITPVAPLAAVMPEAAAQPQAQGVPFVLDAAMAERMLEEAAASMGTSLDAILGLAA